VAFNFPCGHDVENVTLPLGVHMCLSVDEAGSHLALSTSFLIVPLKLSGFKIVSITFINFAAVTLDFAFNREQYQASYRLSSAFGVFYIDVSIKIRKPA